MNRVAAYLISLAISSTAAADRTYQYCQPLLAKYQSECTDEATPRDDTQKAMCAAYKKQIAKECGKMGDADGGKGTEVEDAEAAGRGRQH